MHTVQSIVPSRVQAPTISPSKRRPVSLGAIAALQKLERRESEISRLNCLRALGGFSILGMFVGILIPVLIKWLIAFERASHPQQNTNTDDAMSLIWGINACMLLATFPIAILTSRESRSAQINQFLETGSRSTGGKDNPLVRYLLVLVMLGLLLGEYLIIDVVRSLWIRLRLRDVDRHQIAIILEMLNASPTGIDPRTLLKIGEPALHLRHTLAYLMAFEWADINRHGDCLLPISPAQRQLRHARAGLFEFSA